MKGLVASFRSRFKAVFIAVPWDEEEQGGCLASGRGFVPHQRRGGPGAVPVRAVFGCEPEADGTERSAPVAFPCRMRENHDLFAETSTGCALWNNRERVRALLAEKTG